MRFQGLAICGSAALRIAWQIWPGLPACAAFWLCALYGDLVWLARPTACGRALGALTLLGAISNAAVTLANGGFMPVLGGDGFSIWVAVDADTEIRLLALADRYGGFSLGDFLLIGSQLVYVALLAVRSLAVMVGIRPARREAA